MIDKIVSPDAPTVVNEAGGAQSHVPVRFDLIDGKALFAMAAVLHEGAEKYGADNWRKIPVEDHLNHLIMHAYAYLSGDCTDEHLSHIMCRAMFAQGVELEKPVSRTLEKPVVTEEIRLTFYEADNGNMGPTWKDCKTCGCKNDLHVSRCGICGRVFKNER